MSEPTNRAIIYTLGKTHQIYFNLTDGEAERRWFELCAGKTPAEKAYEKKMGWTATRGEVEFTDELMIWGNPGGELNEMINMVLSGKVDL